MSEPESAQSVQHKMMMRRSLRREMDQYAVDPVEVNIRKLAEILGGKVWT